jgi:phospholipase C
MTGMIDPEGLGGGPIINNKAPQEGYIWTTYAERLEKAGISWKVYQQQDNYGCNMLANFKAFREALETSPLFQKGMARGPEGQFEYDATHDKLPAVSWIIPTGFQSEHPHYMPADGAAFVASKIDAIAANPDVWAKAVFILNYDENDGLFDHVGPVVPPRERRRKRNLSEDFPSVQDFACHAFLFRLGPPVAGSAANASTTRRCCSFWSASRVCARRT